MRTVIVGLIALLLISACGTTPATLKPTDEFVEVTLTASRMDSVWTQLPKSEFTEAFSFTLGEEFVDLDDPTWWERYRAELEKLYHNERGDNPGEGYFRTEITVNVGDATPEPKPEHMVHEVPNVEWLQANVKRGVKQPFLSTQIDLPSDGKLREVVDAETLQRHIDKYDERSELNPMQVIIDGTQISTLWEIFPFPVDNEHKHYVFMETLEDLQEIDSKALLYMFADGKRYIHLQLPDDLLRLTADDLAANDFSTTLKLEIYTR